MNGKLTVVGAKRFKGTVEGVAYDTTKLNVLIPYPRRNPDQSGFDVQVATFQDSTSFKLFEGKTFPLVIEADYELNTKGVDIYEAHVVDTRPQQNAQVTQK